jgi:hypothetical protein
MHLRRSSDATADLSSEQVLQANIQLEREICLIEGWLAELEETSKNNSEAQAARKSYSAMIQSRKQLLQTLANRNQ